MTAFSHKAEHLLSQAQHTALPSCPVQQTFSQQSVHAEHSTPTPPSSSRFTLKSALLIYDYLSVFPKQEDCSACHPTLDLRYTPMLYMVGHPKIPKADAPSRVINYATGMVA